MHRSENQTEGQIWPTAYFCMAYELFLTDKEIKDVQYFLSHESYTKFKCNCPRIKFYCNTARLIMYFPCPFPAIVGQLSSCNKDHRGALITLHCCLEHYTLSDAVITSAFWHLTYDTNICIKYQNILFIFYYQCIINNVKIARRIKNNVI